MIRTLRGAWHRRGTLLPLFLLSVVVVTGAVAVLAFADSAGTSRMLAVPLLLLGAVAVPATGRELALARRGEIALARLRGLQGGELSTLLVVEPLVVLVAGGAVGVGLGLVVGWLVVRAWSDPAATLGVGFGVVPVLVGLAIVLAGLVAVLAGMASALREPLSEQVSVASRPRAASTRAIFGSVLLIAAAVVAVYRSSVAPGEDPDWVVLAGPALVGLAGGQVLVWLVRVVAGALVRRTAGSSLPRFLAVRRLARVADVAAPVRILVAAATVAGLALTGATRVDDWTGDTARLRSVAPLQVELDAGASDALALTRDLDPEGRWLMAAVLVPGKSDVPDRRAFLDTQRYDAVVGDFLDGTPAAGTARHIGALADAAASYAISDTVRATVEGVSRRSTGDLRPRVLVEYLDDSGATGTAVIRTQVGLHGGPSSASARLDGCTGGCLLTSVTLERSPGDAGLPWVLSELDFGGVDALRTEWRHAAPQLLEASEVPARVDVGLLAPAADGSVQFLPGPVDSRTPVLATDTAEWDEGAPVIESPGGDERSADVLARLPALPLVERDGVLADLPRAAAGAPPTVPAAQVLVLARADTPRDVLAALTDAAVGPPQSLAQLVEATEAQTGGDQARVYSLMAGFCLLVALLVLAAAAARQRPAWLRDAAALRAVGVSTRSLRSAALVETLALGIAAVVASIVGALGAVLLLLGNLSLVAVPRHAVPLQSGVAVAPIVVTGLVVAAAVLLVTRRGRGVHAERSRPAVLREEATG